MSQSILPVAEVPAAKRPKPHYDVNIFSPGPNPQSASKTDFKSLFEQPARTENAANSPFGNLHVLSVEVRQMIFAYATPGQTYTIDEDENGDLVYYPPCPYLELSTHLRQENLGVWIQNASFEFKRPEGLKKCLSFLQSTNWKWSPTLSLRYIRVVLLASLEGIRISPADLEISNGPLTNPLMLGWREAFYSIPSSVQVVIFDLTHDDCTMWFPRDERLGHVRIRPVRGLLSLMQVVALRMRMRTAKEAKFCITGCERCEPGNDLDRIDRLTFLACLPK